MGECEWGGGRGERGEGDKEGRVINWREKGKEFGDGVGENRGRGCKHDFSPFCLSPISFSSSFLFFLFFLFFSLFSFISSFNFFSPFFFKFFSLSYFPFSPLSKDRWRKEKKSIKIGLILSRFLQNKTKTKNSPNKHNPLPSLSSPKKSPNQRRGYLEDP